MADEDVKVSFGASIDSFLGQLKAASGGVQKSVEEIKGHLEGLKGVFESLGPIAASFGAALAGGEIIAKSIEEFQHLGAETQKLGQILGAGSLEAGVMMSALGSIGVETETYEQVMQRMTLKLRTSAERFEQLGVTIKDSSGHMLPAQQILQNTITTLDTYKAGTDRNIVSTELLGMSAQRASRLHLLNKEVMEEAAQTAASLGTIMGTDDVQASNKLVTAQHGIKEIFDGIYLTIARELIPIYTSMLETIGEYGPQMVAVAHTAFLGFIVVLESVVAAVKMVWAIIKGVITSVVEGALWIGRIFLEIVQGNYSKAWELGKQAVTSWGQTFVDTYDGVADAARDARKAIAAAAESGQPGVDGSGGGGKSAPPRAGPDNRMAQWKADLIQQKQAKNEFYGEDLASDLTYWQGLVAQASTNAKTLMAVNAEIFNIKKTMANQELEAAFKTLDGEIAANKNSYDTQVQIMNAELALAEATYGKRSTKYAEMLNKQAEMERAHIEKMKQLQEEALTAETEHQIKGLELVKSNYGFEESMGMITSQQRIKLEADADQQIYQKRLALLQETITLHADDVAAVQKAQEQIVALNDAEAQRVLKVQQDTALAVKQLYQGVYDSIANSFSQNITKMIQGTETLKQALGNIWQTIISQILGFFLKMATDWIAKQLLMTVTQQSQNATQTTSVLTQLTTIAAATKAATTSNSLMYAGMAGAAGTASFAGAPWPIDLGAPAFGASMYAAAAAYAPLDIGAWNIPHDGMAPLHAGESVVPKDFATGLRENGGLSGGGGGNSLHVHAIDAKGVKEFLHKHGDEVVKMLQGKGRSFAFNR
jgi:hypothetical protein